MKTKSLACTQLVYSSTCATYGNPETLPVTELTPTDPINPYGRAKLYSERAIKDYAHANPELKVIIFRYFNVYGSDPNGELGEYPPPAVRQHGRISQACLDAAMGIIPELHIMGAIHCIHFAGSSPCVLVVVRPTSLHMALLSCSSTCGPTENEKCIVQGCVAVRKNLIRVP